MNDGNKIAPFAASATLLQILFLIGTLFVFGGCANNTPAEVPNDWPVVTLQSNAKPDENTPYPFSEIGKIYDHFFEEMTSDYFKKFPDLAKEHTKKMQEFIAAEEPRDKFIKEMVHGDYLSKFQRAAQDTVITTMLN